jgi:predicted membrane protein
MPKNNSMHFLSTAAFWGALIVLFGLSIILREVFDIHIPFVKIIFGFILIYWGVRMVFGGFGHTISNNSAVFGNAKMTYDSDQKDYSIVFGNGTIDLFKMEMPTEKKKVDVSVVFGNGQLIINDSIPMKVKMSAAMGEFVAPDNKLNAIGNSTFTTSTFNENQPYVLVNASVVFGKLVLESRKW